MDTLQTIIEDLKKISSENNYSGATVDALNYLIANGIYKNEQNVLVAVLENNASSCSLTNSAIAHAKKKMYSVYRGRNQHIYIKGAIPITTFSVNKYDQCTKIGKYKLLYAKAYKFAANVAYSEEDGSGIELVVCTDVVNETLTSTSRNYVISQNSDLTEDLALFLNDDEIEYATKIQTALNGNTYLNATKYTPYFVLTDTDYGVQIFTYQFGQNLVFETIDEYRIVSPKYCDELLDISKIKNINQFDITKASFTYDDIMYREEDKTSIYLQSNYSERDGNIIRSINDVDEIFYEYFSASNLKDINSVVTDDTIYIYYLKSDISGEIVKTLLDDYRQFMLTSYYVNQNIEIEKAEAYISDNQPNDYEVVTTYSSKPQTGDYFVKNSEIGGTTYYYVLDRIAGSSTMVLTEKRDTANPSNRVVTYICINSTNIPANSYYEIVGDWSQLSKINPLYGDNYDFNVEIYYSNVINLIDITNFVNNYRYRIGKQFNPQELVGKLVNQFDSIEWIDLKSSRNIIYSENDEDKIPNKIVFTGSSSYINKPSVGDYISVSQDKIQSVTIYTDKGQSTGNKSNIKLNYNNTDYYAVVTEEVGLNYIQVIERRVDRTSEDVIYWFTVDKDFKPSHDKDDVYTDTVILVDNWNAFYKLKAEYLKNNQYYDFAFNIKLTSTDI